MSERLDELVAKAKAAWDAMTPEQRAAEKAAQRQSFIRAMQLPKLTPEEVAERVAEYRAGENDLAPELRWDGEGDPPRRWIRNGTIVYRSYADAVDD
jgi:hypothetical protein